MPASTEMRGLPSQVTEMQSCLATVPAGQPHSPAKLWYAVYTRPRHEKQVVAQLSGQPVECFLPLYESVRRWKDRRVVLSMPLFPGYVFIHLNLPDRLKVLQTPGVVNLVEFGGVACPIPDTEIEALQACLACRVRMQPHPYLTVGRRVSVRSGPLAGVEGILVRKKSGYRLVLSIDSINSSVWVELDAVDVEPVTGSRTTLPARASRKGSSLNWAGASS
jgi:transcription antitermination factor NusG